LGCGDAFGIGAGDEFDADLEVGSGLAGGGDHGFDFGFGVGFEVGFGVFLADFEEDGFAIDDPPDGGGGVFLGVEVDGDDGVGVGGSAFEFEEVDFVAEDLEGDGFGGVSEAFEGILFVVVLGFGFREGRADGPCGEAGWEVGGGESGEGGALAGGVGGEGCEVGIEGVFVDFGVEFEIEEAGFGFDAGVCGGVLFEDGHAEFFDGVRDGRVLGIGDPVVPGGAFVRGE